MDLSQWGWREEKVHLTELSLGASGSRFPLSVPRGGGMCVLYIQRVDFRGFVTVGLARGKKSCGGTEPRGLWFQISSLRATWGRDVCVTYTEGRF